MPHADHFRLADDLVAHLDTVLDAIKDPFIESRYTGFVAVSAVTVLELALKTIFIEFAERKHRAMGVYVGHHFDRINGRIGLSVIKDDYLKAFDLKYRTRFDMRLERLENEALRRHGYSVKASYGNLIVWRNAFAHQGLVPANASYAEVKRAYGSGKAIMACLCDCMVR